MVKGGAVDISKTVTIGDKVVVYAISLGTEEISYDKVVSFALWIMEQLVKQDSKEKKEDSNNPKNQAYT